MASDPEKIRGVLGRLKRGRFVTPGRHSSDRDGYLICLLVEAAEAMIDYAQEQRADAAPILKWMDKRTTPPFGANLSEAVALTSSRIGFGVIEAGVKALAPLMKEET